VSRATPFDLALGALAAERFPAIATALEQGGTSSADRDAFVLIQPVAVLLRDLVPDDAPPDALAAYLRLLHHAYRHWAAGGWVFRIGDAALERAVRGGPLTSALARPAAYLQLPEHRVWRAPGPDETPEPLDGVFVTETATPGQIAVLGVSGMHRNRAGFSAVAVEGRADPDDPTAEELLVEIARPDGSPLFAPLLEGGREAGLYSLASAGELLVLTCRLLALLPVPPREPAPGPAPGVERFIEVPA
jgi:hypothetical protein